MISEEIRELIKRERIKQGLSKDDLAAKAGLSVRLIDYWEQNKRKATNIESIDKALRALGITYMIGEDKGDTLSESLNDSLSESKRLPTFGTTARNKTEI